MGKWPPRLPPNFKRGSNGLLFHEDPPMAPKLTEKQDELYLNSFFTGAAYGVGCAILILLAWFF